MINNETTMVNGQINAYKASNRWINGQVKAYKVRTKQSTDNGGSRSSNIME